MTVPDIATVRSRDDFGEAGPARAALPGVLVFVALVGLAFENGGFSPGAWTTAAVGLLWVTALVLVLAPSVESNSLEGLWLGLLGALIIWTAVSASWSFDYAHSFLEVRRDLVYLAGVAAVLLVAQRRSAAYLLAGVWSAATVVVVYALVRYLFEPGLRSGGAQPNLLFRPLGYANAMGIFTGFALILSTGFAVRAPRRAQRTLAFASIAPLTAALYLTSSRASALAVGVGLAAMLAVDRDRGQLIVALLVLAPVGAAVTAASAHSGLTHQGSVHGHGARQAHLLALWIVIGAVLLALARPNAANASRWLGRLPGRRRGLSGAIVVAVLAGTAYAVIRGGTEFFTGGYRPAYWHVAWREYVAHPWLGSGAGTFRDYWERHGDQNLLAGALDAHNLYLETLAELGPVGLVLLVSVLALPLATAVSVRRHPVAPAATGAYVAFLTHAALDWDWEMPVVTLAALACSAAVVIANRDSAPPQLLSGRGRICGLALTIGLALFALIAQFTSGLGGTGP